LRPEIKEEIKIILFILEEEKTLIDKYFKFAKGVLRLVKFLAKMIPHPSLRFSENVKEQALFVLEIVKNQPCGQIGFPGNVLDGKVVVTLLADRLVRRGSDLIPTNLG
jgi:hypothetical protein